MKPLLRSVLLLLLLSAAALWLGSVGAGSFLSSAWMDEHVAHHGAAGRGLFVAVCAALMALGVPRQVPCFLAGHAFGFLEGCLWASIASVCGAAACSLAARSFMPRAWTARFAAAARRLHDFLTGHPFRAALVLRLFPVGHNFSTNVAAGLARAPLGAFLCGSLLGWLPQTCVFVLLGSGNTLDDAPRIAISVALFALSGWIGWRLLRSTGESAVASGIDAQHNAVLPG